MKTRVEHGCHLVQPWSRVYGPCVRRAPGL